MDLYGLEVSGQWVQKPWPTISNIHHPWGTAYRPPFWENVKMFPPSWVPMMVPFEADAQISWKIKCKDTSNNSEWTINDNSPIISLYVEVPLRLAPHYALQRYVTLFNFSELLIKPAKSKAMEKATSMANILFNNVTATSICEVRPKSDCSK